MKMTKAEAKEQLEAFLAKLGDKNASVLEERDFVKANIGDAIMGFVYRNEETLMCQSLIYRFRNRPKENILKAIDAESKDAPNGGGEVAFDPENFTLVLQKDYKAKVSEEDFFNDMEKLAQASLVWSNEVLQRVAERAIPQ